jgi:Iron-containing redox enzyme
MLFSQIGKSRKVETMATTTALAPQLSDESFGDAIQQQILTIVDDLFAELPNPELLTPEQRRQILARYTAVLEGNFIYWMTATYLAVRSEEARPILIENLHEEIRDSHPDMMRKFAIAAHAFPSDTDALEVHTDLTRVRLFLGRLQGVQSLMMMAFFEGFIQGFMPYLAKLAAAQGSHEFVYTDVHGVCDVVHSQELFRAVSLEMSLNPPGEDADLFEGVELLRTLIRTIVQGPALSLN